MKIWINKQTEDTPSEEYRQALIFNILDKRNKSNVKTDIEDLFGKFEFEKLDDIYEDLLFIAISVFCSDKRVIRGRFNDCWTRDLEINIPVIKIEKWNNVKEKLEKTLEFLSGDVWKINFRKSNDKFRKNEKINKEKQPEYKYKAVSLFSGGLDSFCGALKLMEDKISTCFVGFREYNSVSQRQSDLFNAIDKKYNDINKQLLLFSVTPMLPLSIEGSKVNTKVESTSRSRSFLFLAGAISVASMIGKDIPVYIPENGFIGINVPLTDSRNGSCSTRTTHAYFINSLNEILNDIGIKNKINNFYAFKTKGEIVEEFKSNSVFKKYAYMTISCSHPCLARYKKYKTPLNCGYCYPCLIRRASLNKIGVDKTDYNPEYKLTKKFIEDYPKINGIASDFKGVLLSLKKYLINKDDKKYIKSLLLKHGKLTVSELNNYERVYRQSMNEINNMILNEDDKNNGKIFEYLGVKKENKDG